MDNENQELFIDLKDLMFSVLYSWKKIILAVIVFALLAVGVAFAKDHISLGNTDTDTDEVIEKISDEEKYENEKLLLERRIAEYEAMIANQYQYLNESALMQSRHDHAYEAFAKIYVTSDYQIMPGMTYQNKDYTQAVMSHYISALSDVSILQEIAAEVNLDVKYLRELIDVCISDGSFIQIRAYHSSSMEAQQIVDLLVSTIKTLQPNTEKTIGKHSVDVVLESVYLYTEDFISERQRAEEALLIEYETALKKTIDTLASLEAPGSNYLKWSVLGGAAGGVLYVFLLLVAYFTSGVIHSVDELNQYFALKILGKIKNETLKLDSIGRWLRGLEGKTAENTEANYELIAERIFTCTAGQENILVACNADTLLGNEITQNLQQHLSVPKLIICDNMLTDAQAIRSLREYSAIILVEICGKSSAKSLRKELELIKDANCKLIGCIFVE